MNTGYQKFQQIRCPETCLGQLQNCRTWLSQAAGCEAKLDNNELQFEPLLNIIFSCMIIYYDYRAIMTRNLHTVLYCSLHLPSLIVHINQAHIRIACNLTFNCFDKIWMNHPYLHFRLFIHCLKRPSQSFLFFDSM